MNVEAAFKLFDVRGEYPQEVDERLAFLIGKALTLLKKPGKVLVASDTRESSPNLKNYLIDGLASDKVPVFDLNEAPTPQFYYTINKNNYDLGVMVTASHVSDTENGFKFTNASGLPFDQKEVADLKNKVLEMKNEVIVVPKISATRVNNTAEYVQATIERLLVKKFTSKVVLDLTKSAVVTPILLLYSKLGINFSLVKTDHNGNPLLPENRRALAQEVIRQNADLGIIWDSDGDRVVFVNREGKLIPPSFVLGILAAGEIKTRGDKIGVDVRAGLVVRDLIATIGGVLEVFPAWSQYLKFGMNEDPAIVFGGETSGHYVFRQAHLIDDGLLASLKFLGLWEKDCLEEKLAVLGKKYFELPEKNFPVGADRATQVLEKITEYYRTTGDDVSIKDGLTVFGPDFKFNLRGSLTEPFLRLNLEARSETAAQKIIYDIEKHLLV